jgi:hypothetical protein
MKEILALQKKFKNHLYKEIDEEILQSLPYSKQEALARLNIYRNNVFGNFSSVLEGIFEVVKMLVGEKYFSQLCDSYHQKYFSKSGNLDNYGDDFPRFLTQEKSQHKLAFLPDLASLELLIHKSYFADTNDIFPLEKFKKLSQKKFFDLKFSLHPSCFVISSKFAIFSIWKDNIENKGRKKIDATKPEFVLIERILGKVNIHIITKEEFFFLKNINKKTLYKTYEEITKNSAKECDIGTLVNKFITNGVITNFKL